MLHRDFLLDRQTPVRRLADQEKISKHEIIKTVNLPISWTVCKQLCCSQTCLWSVVLDRLSARLDIHAKDGAKEGSVLFFSSRPSRHFYPDPPEFNRR